MEKLAVNGGKKTIKIPFKGREHFGHEEKAAVNELMDQAIATGNAPGYQQENEEAFCRDFEKFMGGSGFADGVSSGTAAVYVALRALELEPFSEVIAGCVTDPGGMMPVALNNCIPVIADSAPDQYNTSPQEIEKMITPLTKAIIVAHIGGEPADIKGIMEVAGKHGNIPVIEDCAQAYGTKLNGIQVGNLGTVAAFSTMFGKHICTGGQGGVVFTKNEELYRRIRRYADRGKPFFMPEETTNCAASLNLNLDEFAAAIGRAQLKKLPGIVKSRQNFAKQLVRKGLGESKAIKIPKLIPGAEHSYWWWRLEINEKALTCSKTEFCEALRAEGLMLATSYHSALPHTMDWFKKRRVFGSSGLPWTSPQYKGHFADADFSCPNAIAAMNKQFNLRLHESWGEPEARLIMQAIRKVEKAYLA